VTGFDEPGLGEARVGVPVVLATTALGNLFGVCLNEARGADSPRGSTVVGMDVEDPLGCREDDVTEVAIIFEGSRSSSESDSSWMDIEVNLLFDIVRKCAENL